MKVSTTAVQPGVTCERTRSEGYEIGVEVVDDKVGELLRELEDGPLHVFGVVKTVDIVEDVGGKRGLR